MRELTYKQRLFVEAYLGEANGNGVEAARIAGYSWPEKQAFQLLGKTRIKAQIARRLKAAAISANEILARMSEIATTDIGEFLDIGEQTWRVRIKRNQRTRLIKKLKQTRTTIKDLETEITEIEVKDCFPALAKLGEYHGLWDNAAANALTVEELGRRMKARKDKKDFK